MVFPDSLKSGIAVGVCIQGIGCGGIGAFVRTGDLQAESPVKFTNRLNHGTKPGRDQSDFPRVLIFCLDIRFIGDTDFIRLWTIQVAFRL